MKRPLFLIAFAASGFLHAFLVAQSSYWPHFVPVPEISEVAGRQIWGVAEDRDGYVWLATERGLFRHAASETRAATEIFPDTLGLLADQVVSLALHQNSLFAGTRNNGLLMLELDDYSLHHIGYHPDDDTKLKGYYITLLFPLNYTLLLVGVELQGLYVLNTRTRAIASHLPLQQTADGQNLERGTRIPNDACHDPTDRAYIWVATQQGLLRIHIASGKYDLHLLAPNQASNPEAYNLLTNNLRTVHADAGGTLWLGTWGGGLVKYNPVNSGYTIFKFQPDDVVTGTINNIFRIIPAGDGTLWTLTPHHPLLRFNPLSGEFLHADTTGFHAIPDPMSISILGNGDLLLGTYSSGLYRSKVSWQSIDIEPLAYPIIARHDIHPDSVYVVYQSTGRHWLALWKGSHKELQRWPLRIEGENYMFANGIRRLQNGEVWVATSRALFRLDGSRQRLDDVSHKDIDSSVEAEPHTSFISVAWDGDTLWMGNKFQGLYRIAPAAKSIRQFTSGSTESRYAMVHQPWPYHIVPDSFGRVWYATEKGFGYYDKSADRMVSYPEEVLFGKLAGEGQELIRHIVHLHVISRDSLLLVFRNSFALALMQGEQLTRLDFVYRDFNPQGYRFTTFTPLQPPLGILQSTGGASLANYVQGTLHPLSQLFPMLAGASLYWTTTDSLFAISGSAQVSVPKSILVPPNTPARLFLSGFRIFDKAWPGITPLPQQPLSLGYKDNFLSFTIGVLNEPPEEIHRLQYRLTGLSPKWMDATEGQGSLSNLRGGRYTLELRAITRSDRVVSEPFAWEIHIKPPFWETTWFLVAVILVIAALLYAVYLLRIRQVRRREQMKAEYNQRISELEMEALRSQMNPHFMFNCLNSIRNLMLRGDLDASVAYTTKFSKLLRLILQHSKSETITLAAELEALELYLALEQLRLGEKLNYALQTGAEVEPNDIKIPPMVLQPYVENGIWHGLMNKQGGGNITVQTESHNGTVEVTITDDGVGRERAREVRAQVSQPHTSFGMAMTNDRLRLMEQMTKLKTNVEITDLYHTDGSPAGTRVAITISGYA